MPELMKKQIGLTMALALLLLSAPLRGQDSITGIYDLGSHYNELILRVNGQFKFTSQFFNEGKPFHGTWTRMNDSTIRAHTDTAIIGWFNVHYLNEFECVESKGTGFLFYYFHHIEDTATRDTLKGGRFLYKVASFHKTGELKQERVGNIVTIYYPNGRIKEVIEYNDHGDKDGLDLKYGSDGRLITIQKWKKGKLKHESNCEPYGPVSD